MPFQLELGVVVSGRSSLGGPVQAGLVDVAVVLVLAEDDFLPVDDVPVALSSFSHFVAAALLVPARTVLVVPSVVLHIVFVILSVAALISP